MSDDNQIHTHAVRLLNPFRGVMNIIEYKGAEAVTIDGINWDIYVKDLSLTRDLESTDNMLISEIRFGHWSADKGLIRGSIYPSDDFDFMEHQGYQIFDYLTSHANEIPFPLTDSYELWLLDTELMPLALLASSYNADKLHYDFPLKWTAGNLCKDYFSTILRNSPMLDYLQDSIDQLAGQQARAQWFKRRTSLSSGLTGIAINRELEGRQLQNDQFPEYYIKEFQGNDDFPDLFTTYQGFLAPYILTLNNLSDSLRLYFEKQSRNQALIVDKLYRLYPKICSEKHITAARVEARLRKAAPTTEKTENVLSPEYIELGISRTN